MSAVLPALCRPANGDRACVVWAIARRRWYGLCTAGVRSKRTGMRRHAQACTGMRRRFAPRASRPALGLCAPYYQENIMGRICRFVSGSEPHAAPGKSVRSRAVRLVVGSALLLGLVAPAAAGWKGKLGFWGFTAVGAGIGLAVGGRLRWSPGWLAASWAWQSDRFVICWTHRIW